MPADERGALRCSPTFAELLGKTGRRRGTGHGKGLRGSSGRVWDGGPAGCSAVGAALALSADRPTLLPAQPGHPADSAAPPSGAGYGPRDQPKHDLSSEGEISNQKT